MDTIRCIIIILTVNNRNLINDLKHTDFTLNKWERFLDSFLSFKCKFKLHSHSFKMFIQLTVYFFR